MRNKNLLAALAILIAMGIAALVAWAGSQSSVKVNGLPLFALCGLVAFALQWLVFIPSFALQTEKLFDLTGCLTYLSLMLMAAMLGPPLKAADVLLLSMCALWALRLGSFLFLRIHQDGSDRRFNDIKPVFMRFLVAWTLQGLWVYLTLCAVLVVVCSPAPHATTVYTAAGAAIWLLGFGLEVIADMQKRAFRANPANSGRFIQTGLWSWSRHPNYLGEMSLWLGVFVCVLPQLQGWQWVALISPLFIVLLLTRVSGVPLLEAQADQRWGRDADYLAYKKATPVLWPW